MIPFPVSAADRRKRSILPPVSDGALADLRRLIDADRVNLERCRVAKSDANAVGIPHKYSAAWRDAWRDYTRSYAVTDKAVQKIAGTLLNAAAADVVWPSGLTGYHGAELAGRAAAMSLPSPPPPVPDRPPHLMAALHRQRE